MRCTFAVAASAAALATTLADVTYCTPELPCWPSKAEWDALAAQLSGTLTLRATDESNYLTCLNQGTNAFGLQDEGNGFCMQYQDCRKQFCDWAAPSALPAYTVAVETIADIQAALSFATDHNISVTVKTSGHSYSGSSTGGDSLLIWMRQFEGNVPRVDDNFTDSCGTTFGHVATVGGGNNWGEVYGAVGNECVLREKGVIAGLSWLLR
jgi:hypothetical protein